MQWQIAITELCSAISTETPEYQYKTIIPYNLYGRWDKFDLSFGHMIPAVIRKIHQAVVTKSKAVEIWGDEKARRQFMYTSDLADCIIHAVVDFEKLLPLMNVGLVYDYTILEYYQKIAEVIGFNGEFVFDLSYLWECKEN